MIRRSTLLAWGLGGFGIACSVAAGIFYALGGDRVVVVYGNEVGIAVGFCTVGAVIASRVPRNSIGWLLLGTGVVHASGFATLEYLGWAGPVTVAHAPRAVVVYGEMSWMPGSITLFTLVPLLFPTGRPPTRRWNVLVWTAVAGYLLSALAVLTGTRRWIDFGIPNPLHDPPVSAVILLGVPLIVLSVLGSVASLVVRYRRAAGALRQQMRWIVWAAVGATVLIVAVLASNAHNALTIALQCLAVVSVPVAMGIAILRYRLYDIDRIVSRTVSYTVVTGLLVGVYVGCVALTTQALPLSSSAGVASSTLVAAALFQPVRRRVQAGVDRRFNRQRYDAARTIDAFSVRLRDEVDPDAVRMDLIGVAGNVMQPTWVSLWVPS